MPTTRAPTKTGHTFSPSNSPTTGNPTAAATTVSPTAAATPTSTTTKAPTTAPTPRPTLASSCVAGRADTDDDPTTPCAACKSGSYAKPKSKTCSRAVVSSRVSLRGALDKQKYVTALSNELGATEVVQVVYKQTVNFTITVAGALTDFACGNAQCVANNYTVTEMIKQAVQALMGVEVTRVQLLALTAARRRLAPAVPMRRHQLRRVGRVAISASITAGDDISTKLDPPSFQVALTQAAARVPLTAAMSGAGATKMSVGSVTTSAANVETTIQVDLAGADSPELRARAASTHDVSTAVALAAGTNSVTVKSMGSTIATEAVVQPESDSKEFTEEDENTLLMIMCGLVVVMLLVRPATPPFSYHTQTTKLASSAET